MSKKNIPSAKQNSKKHVLQSISPSLIEFSWTEAQSLSRFREKRVPIDCSSADHITNAENTFLCINLWVSMMPTPRAKFILSNIIRTHGVIAAISFSASAADLIIKGDGDTENPILIDLIPEIWDGEYDTSLRDVLQLLRFPKRLCLTDNAVITEALLQFLQCNNQCKLQNRKDFSDMPFFYDIQHHYRSITNGLPKKKTLGSFSSGAYSDAKDVLEKHLHCLGYEDYRVSEGYEYCHVPFRSLTSATGDELTGDVMLDQLLGFKPITPWFGLRNSTDVITAVPKSYKAARIIGESSSINQYRGSRILESWAKSLSMYSSLFGDKIDVHDQMLNRNMCQTASLSQEYATIDLSNASDLISRKLVYALAGDEFRKELELMTSSFLQVQYPTGKSKIAVAHMFAPAGNRITFINETTVFYSILRAVADYVTLFTKKEYNIFVYGDDMIVPVEICDCVIEVLGIYGLKVNVEKSFGVGSHYRETCGLEHWDGIPVASLYFPRAKVTMEYDTLIDLQHKLYSNIECRFLLNRIIDLKYPRHTWSQVGENITTPWYSFPTQRTILLPISPSGVLDKWHNMEEKEVKVHYLKTSKARGYSLNAELKLVADQYLYTEFLKHGPIFANDFEELAGVSTRRILSRDTEDKWSLCLD